MLRLCLCLIASSLYSACACAAQNAPKPEPQVEVVKNLHYRSGKDLSAYEQERCVLDLYLPKTRKDCSVIVWFHGGGMTGGKRDEADAVAVAKRFAEAGIAVASVEYRLYPKVKYPDFIDDVAAGTAWVMKHISEYGGNPKSVFVAGHSAGGYLTGILGMDPKYLAKYGVDTAQLRGMIPVSGQAFTHYVIRAQHGVPNPNEMTVCDDAAPCYHVRKDAPPILIIMGDNDWPARSQENDFFLAMLKVVGHPDAEFKKFAGRNHGTIIGKISEPNDPVFAAMLEFVEKHRAR